MPLGNSMIFKTINGVAIVAGTPASVWTPATGKKFRLVGYHLGATVAAASVIFKEGAGHAAINLQTPVLTLSGPPDSLDLLGGGILSAVANNDLQLDVTANATITGTVWGYEE